MTDKTEQFRECIGLMQGVAGDIRFNAVGGDDWALKAAETATEVSA